MLDVYEELGETSRRMILAELRSGAKNVSELVQSTGLKQPNVSNHLSRMRTKEIVRSAKVGREVYYSLASPEIEAVVQAVFAVRSIDAPKLDFEDLAKRYAQAAVQADEGTCSEILDIAYRASTPLLDIYQDLLTPAMTLVGTWYTVDAIDVAQEHFASSITERMMARTMQIAGTARKHGRTVLLGCGPDSWHCIGLRMISDYLRLMGWRTLYLGANVPEQSFLRAVELHRPSLVLVSISAGEGVEPAKSLMAAIDSLRYRRNFVVGIGGGAINRDGSLLRKIRADFSAPDLRTFAEKFLPGLEANGRLAESHQSS